MRTRAGGLLLEPNPLFVLVILKPTRRCARTPARSTRARGGAASHTDSDTDSDDTDSSVGGRGLESQSTATSRANASRTSALPTAAAPPLPSSSSTSSSSLSGRGASGGRLRLAALRDRARKKGLSTLRRLGALGQEMAGPALRSAFSAAEKQQEEQEEEEQEEELKGQVKGAVKGEKEEKEKKEEKEEEEEEEEKEKEKEVQRGNKDESDAEANAHTKRRRIKFVFDHLEGNARMDRSSQEGSSGGSISSSSEKCSTQTKPTELPTMKPFSSTTTTDANKASAEGMGTASGAGEKARAVPSLRWLRGHRAGRSVLLRALSNNAPHPCRVECDRPHRGCGEDDGAEQGVGVGDSADKDEGKAERDGKRNEDRDAKGRGCTAKQIALPNAVSRVLDVSVCRTHIAIVGNDKQVLLPALMHFYFYFYFSFFLLESASVLHACVLFASVLTFFFFLVVVGGGAFPLVTML